MKKMEERAASTRREVITTDQHTPKRRRGGLITIPFILVNEAFERVASHGLLPNMIFYLTKNYHMGVAQATSTILLWNAATNFMPLLGAFISDSYLGRFLTIGLGSIFSLWGMIIMWLTAMLPYMRPPPCDSMTQKDCKTPTEFQMAFLVISMGLISIGAGGIRPCSLAFGADQLGNGSNSENKGVLESYFGWYYASTAIAVLISKAAVVYIQDHYGWKVGYGVPAILMFISVFSFFIASPLYYKQKEESMNLLTGFAQVLVAAYKNRKVPFPPRDSDSKYHHKKNSESIAPTENLRFLNKACIIRNPEQDLALDGSASNPWSLCTVQRVEELKTIIRLVPIWSTGIMISISVGQASLQVLQASSMDRHLTSNFEIPAGSFPMFIIITLIVWILLYDRAIIPLASIIKGNPVRLSVKLRMGIGIFFSCLAMVVSGIVENIRRRKAILEGLENNPKAVVSMSALWLIPQFCLHGLAEAFNTIAQSEFFYSELPKNLSSIAGALGGLENGVANLLATVILRGVNQLTSKEGNDGWVPDNINKGRYDSYYGLLAILGFGNLLYYVLCCRAYGPCKEQTAKVGDEGNELNEEEEMYILGTKSKEREVVEGEELSRI